MHKWGARKKKQKTSHDGKLLKMVLVDTNVWIEHFKKSSPELIELLVAGQVVTHDFILGEISLALFSKNSRQKILDRLHSLEKVTTGNHEDVYQFSLKHKLSGKGIGWIDTHLLYTCKNHHLQLYTLDKNLRRLAGA